MEKCIFIFEINDHEVSSFGASVCAVYGRVFRDGINNLNLKLFEDHFVLEPYYPIFHCSNRVYALFLGDKIMRSVIKDRYGLCRELPTEISSEEAAEILMQAEFLNR